MKKGRKIFNEEERLEILKKTGFRCAHCGKQINVEDMTVEHIFPFSKGGDNSEFNLTALCKKCNNDKSNFVYDIYGYYRYILDEYKVRYMSNFISIKTALIDAEELIGFGNMEYRIQSSENIAKVRGMINRGGKKNRETAMRFLEKTAVRLSLERAYPAQASEIAKFCKKVHERTGVSIGHYDNEYVIMDHMRKGRILTLCNKMGEIFGVFAFIHVKHMNLDFPQLQNLCENTGLQPVYVITLAVCNEKAYQCLNDIMTDFFLQFMDRKCITLYFGESVDFVSNKNMEVISLPLEFEKLQGYLQFYTLKSMKYILKQSTKEPIAFGIYTEEMVDDMIEQTFDPNVACSDWKIKVDLSEEEEEE